MEQKKSYVSPAVKVFGSVRNLTGGSTGTRSDGRTTLRTQATGSERRLKENIVKVGDHDAGFGLYLFDYKAEYRELCGHGRQFGVMIDEVEGIVPEAISTHEAGFRVVDYSKLGITRH